MILVRPDIAGPAAGIVVLAGLALWQVAAPVSPTQPAPASHTARPLPAMPEAPPVLSIGPRESFAEVEERPLFLSSRRPPAPPTAEPVATEQPQDLDKYTVLGIVAAPDHATAVISGPGGEPLHLREGQMLDGWTLETIEPLKLVFVSGDQRHELPIKTNKGSANPGPVRTTPGTSQ